MFKAKRVSKVNKFGKASKFNKKGFSLIEVIIAVVLLIGVLSVVLTMTMGGIKASRTSQNIADLRILSLQKVSELSNNLDNELKQIALGQTRIGSINPSTSVNGYFDILNENGCIVQKSRFVAPPVEIEPPIKGAKAPVGGIGGDSGSGGTSKGGGVGGGGIGGSGGGGIGGGGLGDIGDDIPANTVDCSKSTFGTPSNSTNPRYRRQWVVTTNKLGGTDTTITVIVVDLVTNQIVRHETLVKIDGDGN
ncbi:MAG: SNF-related serine/threonine-protein kinase-like [bacterium]|nr:MAG: SNF-related serine/threonine-protein kinase-like [bacterium]